MQMPRNKREVGKGCVRVMETYQYYRDCCAICGKELPKRSMNKIFIGFSHIRYATTPKTIAFICDDCLPELYDTLGVIEPERESKRADKGKPRDYCKKLKTALTEVGKSAVLLANKFKQLITCCEVQNNDL